MAYCITSDNANMMSKAGGAKVRRAPICDLIFGYQHSSVQIDGETGNENRNVCRAGSSFGSVASTKFSSFASAIRDSNRQSEIEGLKAIWGTRAASGIIEFKLNAAGIKCIIL
uniref:Uncharacterized protein n=1 Tax=Romanomermis culicivorax TaxID=13658 RepID=A0A915IW10_ROMCU